MRWTVLMTSLLLRAVQARAASATTTAATAAANATAAAGVCTSVGTSNWFGIDHTYTLTRLDGERLSDYSCLKRLDIRHRYHPRHHRHHHRRFHRYRHRHRAGAADGAGTSADDSDDASAEGGQAICKTIYFVRHAEGIHNRGRASFQPTHPDTTKTTPLTAHPHPPATTTQLSS